MLQGIFVCLLCSLDSVKLLDISSNFQRFQQEDAHEFLQCFLDRLEGCHEPKNKSVPNDNIVQQVFGGRLVSNV